jgi:4-hydroxybenzoyl-CoA reductase subunit beta
MLRLPQFRYFGPRELAEAAQLLHEHGAQAMVVAGGTDLFPNMKRRQQEPAMVIGLRGIAQLGGIVPVDGGLRIGALATLQQLSTDTLVRQRAPALGTAAHLVSTPPLRRMGTLGGNLCLDTRCTYYNQSLFWRQALGFCLKKDGDVCHVTRTGKKCVAAHSADTVPALITLGASVDLVSADGTRTVGVDPFFVADGMWNTVRRRDELVARVRIPLPDPSMRTAYVKVRQRNSIDFPLLSIAAAAELAPDETVRRISLVVSALGSRPRVVTGLDKIAAGHRLGDVVEAVAQQAYKQCHPLENIIVDPDWRRAMVPVYVRRALQEMIPPRALAA